MPSYLAPGVYVEEVPAGPAPIPGVSTSTAGFVGMTRRGRLVGRPELVTSWGQFRRTFGGFFDLGDAQATMLPYAVEAFFANGGQRLYVMRVTDSTTAASVATTGGLITRLIADTVLDPPAQAGVLRLATLRGIVPGTTLVLRMTKGGITTESASLTVSEVDRRTNAVTVQPVLTEIFEARFTTVFTSIGDLPANADSPATLPAPITTGQPGAITLAASSPGAWGREAVIEAAHESAAQAAFAAWVSGAVDDNVIRLVTGVGFYVGAWVEIDSGASKRYRRVLAVDGPMLTLDGPALAAGDLDPDPPATQTIVSTCEFSLTVSFDGTTERYAGLTLADVPGRAYRDRLTANGLLVADPADPPATHPFLFPSGPDGLHLVLTGGDDGTVPPNEITVRGTDNGPGAKSGVAAFEEVDQVSILAAPGLTERGVQNALIEQCERLGDRFAVLDPKPGTGGAAPSLTDIQDQRSFFDSSYAALYYPRVIQNDIFTNKPIPVPPSGHVVGVYARVDESRGVHKAPANEVIRGILDLELSLTKGEHEILNPLHVNVLRNFRTDQRGLRVFGARCLTSDPLSRHVNVRRLLLFIKESLDEGTQWVVFEPNDERLWARVRQSVSFFLTRVWRDGALMGGKPEEAFFVRCDRSTMSDDDILNGRLVMEVGVAPVRPAEFVIIRIGQWLGGSAAQELG